MSEPTEPAKAATVTVTVAEGDDGRVDKALARHFPDVGRKQLADLFETGDVRVRGKRAKKGDRVVAGDVIELARTPVSGAALHPIADPDITLDVLVERDELVAIAKPAGLPSQPLRAGERGTIANAIAARWPECATIGDDPRDGGLVHRLDIGTSGVLVAARTDAAYRDLRAAFGQGRVEKQYLAITCARPVSRECDAPLAQRGDHVRVDHTDGLPAYTQFIVERATATHALVRCIAQTGRMHQVRAHLAHVGSPIVGDTLYGGAPVADHPGFFLHAAQLRLPAGGEELTIARSGSAGPRSSPERNAELVIAAPLPARFTAALATLGLAG